MARFFIPDTCTRIYYYVDKAGKDSTGNGSVGNPYATINKPMQSLNSYNGNLIPVVVIGAGNWQETITNPTKNIEAILLPGCWIDGSGTNWIQLTTHWTKITGIDLVNSGFRNYFFSGNRPLMIYGSAPNCYFKNLFLNNIFVSQVSFLNEIITFDNVICIFGDGGYTSTAGFKLIACINSLIIADTNCNVITIYAALINSIIQFVNNGNGNDYSLAIPGLNYNNNFYPTAKSGMNNLNYDVSLELNDWTNGDCTLKSSSHFVGAGQYGANIGPLGIAKGFNGKNDAIQNAQFSITSGTPDIIYDNTTGIITLDTGKTSGILITEYVDRIVASAIQRIGHIGTTIYDSSGNPTEQVDINGEGGLFPMACLGLRYGNSINSLGEIDFKFSTISATSSSGQATVNVTSNSSFSPGDKIIIVKSDGTMELATVDSLGTNTLVLTGNLGNSYAAGDKIYGYMEVVENMPLLIDASGRTTGNVNFDISTGVQISARFVQLVVKMHT